MRLLPFLFLLSTVVKADEWRQQPEIEVPMRITDRKYNTPMFGYTTCSYEQILTPPGVTPLKVDLILQEMCPFQIKYDPIRYRWKT